MRSSLTCRAFTVIEIIFVLVLVGVLVIFGSRILTTVVRGYVVAQNSDEIVQKAQMVLQRMTVEFSYINATGTTGGATSLNYNGGSAIGNHSITLSGSNILYSQNGTNYILTDGVAGNGLVFSYYNAYDSPNASSFSAGTNIIEISLTMKGDDAAVNITQKFVTRVAIKKF